MHLTPGQASRRFHPANRRTMRPADVSSLRMLRRVWDRIDRDYADDSGNWYSFTQRTA